MSAYIQHIVNRVPAVANDQQKVRELMKELLGEDRKTKAIIHRIYSQSGIQKRHSVLEDFGPGERGQLFFDDNGLNIPDTGKRNKVYEKEAKKLFVETASEVLDAAKNVNATDITHVITVSCTGFFAPGPEFEIVKSLGLKKDTQRFHLGFMGCFAAFPALKMARSFCSADPDAKVLIVCVELCSLHFQMNTEIDHLISGSVFADGAAGLLVTGKKPAVDFFSIEALDSSLVLEGEKDMAWTIGEHGFEMVLSTYVPDLIQNNLNAVLSPVFDRNPDYTPDSIRHWAIHPGGRSIVDKIQIDLGLSDAMVQSSRKVLANFGNMSSATILFVLKETLENSDLKNGDPVLALAFGPGLTIETGLLKVNRA